MIIKNERNSNRKIFYINEAEIGEYKVVDSICDECGIINGVILNHNNKEIKYNLVDLMIFFNRGARIYGDLENLNPQDSYYEVINYLYEQDVSKQSSECLQFIRSQNISICDLIKKPSSTKFGYNLHKKYSFEGFMHETHIDNLESILYKGSLVPRKYLSKFKSVANQEIINNTNDFIKSCNRFYFFKQTPTNYHFDVDYPNKMIYLVFSWKIIYKDKAYFTDGNAKSRYSNFYELSKTINNLENIKMDWNLIFDRTQKSLSDTERRLRNAELIIPHYVRLQDELLKIIFPTKSIMRQFINNFNDKRILNMFIDKMIVDDTYFYKNDYFDDFNFIDFYDFD